MKKHHFINRVFVIILLLIIVAGNTQKTYCAPATGELMSGMMVDCARRYYSVETIKGFIDALSGHDGAFLQLHLTDDQNVGVECVLLNQTKDYAEHLPDGSYRNIQTGKRFLSSEQIAEIISYAAQKNVEIIPEIDAPAHMEGFFTLKEQKDGKAAADTLAYDRTGYPGELNISSQAAVNFVKDIYNEYADMFKSCSLFHIGCDELFSGTAISKTSYITTMSSYMMNKGFTVRMWNDLLTKNNISGIDKNIQVTYWSYDGDAQDPATINERRAERASVPELQTAGFDLLIYNSYYLYYVPSVGNYNTNDNDYAVNDVLNNWTVRNWDSNSGISLTSTERIIGSATSLWSEDSSGLTESQISAHFIRLYEAMAEVNRRTALSTPYTPHVASAVADDTSITIAWDAASNAEGYRVYRKTASENWTVIADNLDANTTSYTDTTAQTDTTYYYTVQSYLTDPIQGVQWSGIEEPGVDASISSSPGPGPGPATTGSITIINSTPTKTYEIYRILDLTMDATGSSTVVNYSINPDWADFFRSGNGDAFIHTVNTGNLFAVELDGNTCYLSIPDSDAALFSKEARTYAAALAGNDGSETAQGDTLLFDNLPLGYYLVNPVDATLSRPGFDSIASLVSTLPNAAIYAKDDYLVFTKTADKQDVEVGQLVTFTINGVVPDTTGYNSYLYKITDHMSSGLKIMPATADLTVRFGSDVIDYSAYRTMNGGADITLSDSDMILTFNMTAHQAYIGEPITVTYKATITEQAIATVTKNEATLLYSNNPDDASSTDTIGPICVPVYTSKIVLTKTDADNRDIRLENAGFILTKKSVNPFQYYVYDQQTGICSWSENENDADIIMTDANGVAVFNVSDGTYALKEVKAPAGYSLSAQAEYPVVIAHATDKSGLPVGVIKNIVIGNSSAAMLPMTGSIGTAIFRISGAIILLTVTSIAFVIFFRRRRMSDKEEPHRQQRQ